MNTKLFKRKTSLLSKSILIIALTILTSSCEKFLEVKRLETQIYAEQVFENDAMANAAITGLYRNLRGLVPTALILNNSLYANDVVPYANSIGSTYYTLNIQPNDSAIPWANIYTMIYGANNALSKLNNSQNINPTSKKRYIAEAKFMRALGFFHLVNLFGDVPMPLTPDVDENKLLPRIAIAKVYDQIVADLKEAKVDLPEDYAHAATERVRANKWGAAALLARVFLFQKDYGQAEIEANAVITSGRYSMLSSANGIFTKNNNEAIFQIANNSTEGNNIASSFIFASAPTFVCSPSLLGSFEPGDQRRNVWVRTTTYAGQPVSVPFKYTSTAVNPLEYMTMIRLAEMYLIRAEAKNHRNDFQGCADDVNYIRARHGGLTTPLAAPTDLEAGVNMIMHERQVEFFTEGCHRFFDLKRTGKWAATMMSEKSTFYKATSNLYPIPLSELQRNPSLKPNPGYD